MEALSLALTALLEVMESRLYGFPLKDIMNLQCWLATLRVPTLNDRTGIRLPTESPTAGIADLKASLARMNLDVTCLGNGSEVSNGSDCGSPGMKEWVDIMATPEAQAGATESMNSVLAYVASLLSGGGAILQTPIDRILNEAPIQCPHNPDYNPEALLPVSYESIEALPEHEYSYEYLILWGSIALALIVAFVVLAAGVRCSVRRKHRRWLASTAISNEERRHLAQQQREEDDIEEGLNAATGSMFRSPEIPLLVRWGMPLVVLGNIALFLSGHLNLGANVYIEANLAGETIRVEDFFDFAIARSTIDIWKAGGKSLAILILVFSGIWPYTKQFLTLVLWFLPTSWMSISTRGTYLIWIDRLAKWSMIDIFVIVVCIAAFRVSIMSPEVAFLPENFYSVDLLVVPMWGLYSNMTAQIVSQVSSHFIIYYHRCIVKKAMHALQQHSQSEHKTEGDASFILLWAHSFSNPHLESSEKLVAKNWVSSSILVSSVFMAAFVVLGSVVPSFSVEILGIIGIAVESGQKFEEAITHHSVWSIVTMLFEQARFLDVIGDYIGVGILGSLVLATVMVVPILQALGLIYQWFIPLTQNGRRRLSVVNEILQAWQYVEVYLIALFVASW
jgi:predicted transcriptional regulator